MAELVAGDFARADRRLGVDLVAKSELHADLARHRDRLRRVHDLVVGKDKRFDGVRRSDTARSDVAVLALWRAKWLMA